MGDTAKLFIAGVVAIGLVTAFGLHASGLAQVAKSGGQAGQGLLGTAISGKS
jgi:hypothetical protein